MSTTITVNNTIRGIVLGGLSSIPEVGGLISSLVGILWPTSGEDIWSAIKDDVEALIDQDLDDLVYQTVQDDLTGLQNVLADYETALSDSQGDPSYISEKYNDALAAFETAQPHFESQGYELLLLPLLAQMANLHLSLLRDGATTGSQWGWTDQAVADTLASLQEQISGYTAWVEEWVANGLSNLQLPSSDPHHTEVWSITNNYQRGMTLAVTDLSFYWPYFDPESNPGGSSANVPQLTREIYSDPLGTADDSKFSVGPAPTEKITSLRVWGWDRIDAIQVQTGSTWGPRMGDSDGGSDEQHGWNGSITDSNPITSVDVYSGDIVNGMQLYFSDGTQTDQLGRNYVDPQWGAGDLSTWSYDGEIVSSFKIMGVSNYYGSADCLVIGFRFADSY